MMQRPVCESGVLWQIRCNDATTGRWVRGAMAKSVQRCNDCTRCSPAGFADSPRGVGSVLRIQSRCLIALGQEHPMSTQPVSQKPLPPELVEVVKHVPHPDHGTTDSFDARSEEGDSEELVDKIEQIGEEQAAGFGRRGPSEVTAGMRYLHCSRTIHQLVTDRNRAVGIYLAVASLLWTASSALLNIRPENVRHLIVPIELVQRWCLPATFGTLTVLALFVAFLLIRTRIGLIYEVAKMNILLGLPVGRVQRINLLSIFFLLHLLISLAGGVSGMLLTYHLLHAADPQGSPLLPSSL